MSRRYSGGPGPAPVALLLLVALSVVALPAAPAVADARLDRPVYTVRAWSRQQGLPANSASALAQDGIGYLWVGTFDGIARFDGSRFQAIDPERGPGVHIGRVTSLLAARDGTLWIGHETGAVTQLVHGTLLERSVPSAASPSPVIGLIEAPAGNVWAFHRNGVACDLVHHREIALSPSEMVPGWEVVFQPVEDGFIVNCSTRLFRWTPDAFVPLATPRPDEAVYGTARSRKGGLWIASGGRIRRLVNDEWVEDRGAISWPAAQFARPMVEMADGSLAVGTYESGLYIVGAHGWTSHIDERSGLPDNCVRSLIEDREGNLWVGTSRGLVSIRHSLFRRLRLPDNGDNRPILAIAPSRGQGLWIGTEGNGLYRYGSGRWDHFGSAEGLSNGHVWSILEDQTGTAWVGTWGGGLYRQTADGRFAPVPAVAADAAVLALALEPGARALWVGTSHGALHLAEGAPAVGANASGGTLDADVRAIAPLGHKEAWVGTMGGGIARVAAAGDAMSVEAAGLPAELVESILREPDGTLWIGTSDRGLVRFRAGRIATINRRQGLPENYVGHVLDDGKGVLWLSTHNGLLRVLRTSAEACADGRVRELEFERFGVDDGLPTVECMGGQGAACRDEEGRLWFATVAGVVALDPNAVIERGGPPPVVVEAVRLDGVPVAVGSNVVVPPGVRRIDVEFTGLTLTHAADVRFRYRLAPHDARWADLETRREVGFSYLAPGDYVLEIIACGRDRTWSAVPTRLELSVRPYVWQTTWARLGAAVGLIGGALLTGRSISRRRLQRRLERAQRLQEMDRERTRIARDIHDDLGATLTSISLLAGAARVNPDAPAPVQENLSRISSLVRNMTQAMDEIVWAVNPSQDHLRKMANYLGTFADEHLRATGVRYRLQIPPLLPDWVITAEIRHNLFLAFKEVLNNVTKHSAATEVRIALDVSEPDRSLRLIVEDNGVGLAPTAVPRAGGGNGLHNIVSRLTEIGGTAVFEAPPSGGTRAILSVKIPSNLS